MHRIVSAAALASLIFSSGCARRTHDLLKAQEEAKRPSINHLTLPAIRGIEAKNCQGQYCVTWFNTMPELLANKADTLLLGYNVYRFKSGTFVPGHPLNKSLIKESAFIDTHTHNQSWCYLVRGVVLVHGKVVETPTSQVVCVQQSLEKS